jgi:hypothetical protein
MRSLAIAAALAAAFAITGANAVTPEVKAQRAAVSAAQSEFTAARDKAKKDYVATKTACMRLAAENRASCVDEAKAIRDRALGQARTNYNIEVAKAKATTKGA